MRRSRPVDVVTPVARTKPEDHATQSLKRAIRLPVPFGQALTATSFGSLSSLTRFEFLVFGHRLCAEPWDTTGCVRNGVFAPEVVVVGDFGFVHQHPQHVFAALGQPGVIHQRISELPYSLAGLC